RAIVGCLQAGASVIVESGAGFAANREFRAHRGALRDYLQLQIEAPVDLWPDNSSQRIPYVDYSWPRPAKVRDFTRVVPLGRQAGEVIARVDGLPVALKRSSGRGNLIFLGSPLGPALWAGEAEARRWLFDCLGTAGGERVKDRDLTRRSFVGGSLAAAALPLLSPHARSHAARLRGVCVGGRPHARQSGCGGGLARGAP